MPSVSTPTILLECGDSANVTGHERKAYLPQSRRVLALFWRLLRYGQSTN